MPIPLLGVDTPDAANPGSATLIAQIFLFLTTLAGFGYQAYRDNRQRKWDREDRAEKERLAAADRQAKFDQLERDLSLKAAQLAQLQVNKTDTATQEVVREVHEVKDVNIAALDAANKFHTRVDELEREAKRVAEATAKREAAAIAEATARRLLDEKLRRENDGRRPRDPRDGS